MPKYFCDYCQVFLTHDSRSVRKAHSIGRNHVKLVSDYYEARAKELGLLQSSAIFQAGDDQDITVQKYNLGAPGLSSGNKKQQKGKFNRHNKFAPREPEVPEDPYELLKTRILPPPPPLSVPGITIPVPGPPYAYVPSTTDLQNVSYPE